MKISKVLLLFALLVFGNQLDAQKLSWSKRVKMAEEFMAKGSFAQAAEYYRSAYQDKNKPEFMYKAGECYMNARDYANAAKCYEKVKDLNKEKEFEKPGYKYAMALKQSGEYAKAREAFEEFGKYYGGADYQTFTNVVKAEMAGCDYGMELESATKKDAVFVEQLDSRINTPGAEFAPIPFEGAEGDVLFYSSNADGTTKIYKSSKGNSGWAQRQLAEVGKVQKPHYCNGSFSADGERFYFTQCDLSSTGSGRCDIYMMEKESPEGAFKAPVILPDYINAPGKTSTQPHIISDGKREILLFVSDREGGKGGKDIWYTARNLEREGFNFNNPINLGSVINTPGDDITPFYDIVDGYLYYSTTGHRSLGGFDIFKSKGDMLNKPNTWEKAQNLGLPFNSPADDLYYTMKDSRSGGYFVSNRLFTPFKTTTVDDDIFFFGKKDVPLVITGKVSDTKSGIPVADSKIGVYEITKDGSEKLIKERMSEDGGYIFTVPGGKNYRIKASHPQYYAGKVDFNGKDGDDKGNVNKSFEMAKVPLAERVVPAGATADAPYVFDAKNPPRNPETGEVYGEFSDEFKEWNRIANIAKLSRTGTVYFENGNVVPADPIPVVKEPVVAEKPAKPTKGSKNKKHVPASNPTPDASATSNSDNTQPTVMEPRVVTNESSEPTVSNDPKPAKSKSRKDKNKPASADPSSAPSSSDNSSAATTEPTASSSPSSKKTSKFAPKSQDIGKPLSEGGAGNAPEGIATNQVIVGTLYKIQLSAIKGEFDPKSFKKAEKYGTVETEPGPDGYTRVVIGVYESIDAAREALHGVRKAARGFDDAFINRYEDNNRVGDGFR